MRARVKIYPIRSITEREPMERPNGISDAEWETMKKHFQESEDGKESMFGRSLPFSRTPKGTVAFPWIQADGGTSYEIDLTPKNDEASIKLVSIYPLDRIARSQIENAGLTISDNPFSFSIILYVGYLSHILHNQPAADRNKLLYELAVKFWIIAENLTNEASEIFHIEISASLDMINCRKVRRHSIEYMKLDKLLGA